MIRRIRWAGLASLAWLAAASVCLAAEPSYGPRKGGIGGAIGANQFLGAGDYSLGAQPRFAFSGAFRYVISPSWRWQISPGFEWAAYKIDQAAPILPDYSNPVQDSTKTHYVALLLPISAQLQYVLRTPGWYWHAGVGPGVYRVWVENRRKVLKDPTTFRLHRGVYPGFTAELGAERFLKSITTTSVEAVVGSHYVFAKRNDQFPVGYNDNVWAVDFRIGVNYYFDLVRAKQATGRELPGIKP